MMDIMKTPRARAAVLLALDEDMGSASCVRFSRRCDATSEALVDPKAKATGEIYARVPCVVSGATVAAAVLKAVDRSVKVQILKPDGSQVKPNETILQFTGRARSILAAERTALNFMQRMCATATLTRKFVDATKRWGTLILDTRKTTPGLRVFEKYAVESLRECESALKAKPEWIMLDNMSCADMKKCVKMCRGISKTEASGGITLDRAKEVAATGVTAISLGCLTHSQGSIDLTLEWKAV